MSLRSLKHLSDEELEQGLKACIEEERQHGLRLLALLDEIERLQLPVSESELAQIEASADCCGDRDIEPKLAAHISRLQAQLQSPGPRPSSGELTAS